LIDEHAHEDGGLFVSDIVLVELAWTLARTYAVARKELGQAIRALSENVSFRFESVEALRQALDWYEKGVADFPDCLIVTKAANWGATATFSFDRRMRGLVGVNVG
jgi:predicted nucleic-acid-binding protein